MPLPLDHPTPGLHYGYADGFLYGQQAGNVADAWLREWGPWTEEGPGVPGISDTVTMSSVATHEVADAFLEVLTVESSNVHEVLLEGLAESVDLTGLSSHTLDELLADDALLSTAASLSLDEFLAETLDVTGNASHSVSEALAETVDLYAAAVLDLLEELTDGDVSATVDLLSYATHELVEELSDVLDLYSQAYFQLLEEITDEGEVTLDLFTRSTHSLEELLSETVDLRSSAVHSLVVQLVGLDLPPDEILRVLLLTAPAVLALVREDTTVRRMTAERAVVVIEDVTASVEEGESAVSLDIQTTVVHVL